jgi:RNA polymerase sigma-70 factor (ECF subfamily)
MVKAMDRLKPYIRSMRKLLLRRGCSHDDAEDLIQDAFLRMQAFCDEGGEVREPEAFLVRTVMRLRSNARLQRQRRPYETGILEDLELIDTSPLPDEVFAAQQCLERMRNRLDAVSLRTREILFMHRLDGLSYAEIADRLKISVSTVEKHIASGVAILMKEVGPK